LRDKARWALRLLACPSVRSRGLHARGQAEGGAGRAWHVQPVSDPFEYFQSGDTLDIPHDVAGLALSHAAGNR